MHKNFGCLGAATITIGAGIFLFCALGFLGFQQDKTSSPPDVKGGLVVLSVMLLLSATVTAIGIADICLQRSFPTEKPDREPRHDGTCEICKGSGPAAEYRYYPAVTAENLVNLPTLRQTKYSYSSLHYVEVLICDRCIGAKRKQALLWHTLGFIVSIPFMVFGVGIFGVLLLGQGLLKLRTKTETGDILAYNWFARGEYQLAWMEMKTSKTRRQFRRL